MPVTRVHTIIDDGFAHDNPPSQIQYHGHMGSPVRLRADATAKAGTNVPGDGRDFVQAMAY